MMATVQNSRAPAAELTGATAGEPANGQRDGPDTQRIGVRPVVSGPRTDEHWQGIALQTFQVVPHPGLHRFLPAAESRVTSRLVVQAAVRAVFWSCSMIGAGMRSVARRRREFRIVAALERLDDVTLKDLGICRCEIEYLARTQDSGKWRS